MGRTKPEWAEVHRQPVGFQAGSGKSGAWFSVVYRVTEARKVRGVVADYRERVVHGPSLWATSTPDLALQTLMHTVAAGVDALSRYAEAEKTTKATPGRKRR